MSRDYYPLYLETTITSSNWTSLEQQQQDAIETEVEPIDREARHQADIAKSFTLSAVSDTRKQLLAPGEEYEFEDIVRPAIEFARDMAAVADVAAMRVIEQAANKLHRVDDNTNATLPTIATIAIPTESLPFKPEPTPTPTADPKDTQLVNAVDPAQPPATSTSTPFFLATADPVSIATLDCMRVYQSPAKTTPEYRTQMSQLVWELWDKLDQAYPFQSVRSDKDQHYSKHSAHNLSSHSPRSPVCCLSLFRLLSCVTCFLMFAASSLMRLIILLYPVRPLRVSPPMHSSLPALQPVTSDARVEERRELQRQAPNYRDGQKQTKETTERGDVGDTRQFDTDLFSFSFLLLCSWSHLSHILSKSSELLTRLDQSPWKDRTHRPLQSEAIWTTTITT